LSDARRVTWDDAEERPSGWAADGKRLYYVVRRPGAFESRALTVVDGPAWAVGDDRPIGPERWSVEDGSGARLGWRDAAGGALELVRQVAAGEVTALGVREAAGADVGRPGPASAWFRCAPASGAGCLVARASPDAIRFFAIDARGHVGSELLRLPPSEYAAVSRWDVDQDGRHVLAVHGGTIMRYGLDGSAVADSAVKLPCWPQHPAAARGASPDFFTATCLERPSYRVFEVGPDRVPHAVRESDHRWYAHPMLSPDGRLLAWAERAFQTDVWLVHVED
jgi:hypothetical protein